MGALSSGQGELCSCPEQETIEVGEVGEGEMVPDVAMSPRKAFSLAMRGGLKEFWALEKWAKGIFDIFE